MFRNPLTTKIVGFLTAIGIDVVPADLASESFLPGILVNKGRLLVDEEKLIHPGDLLHEAGHLAVAPAECRCDLGGEVVIPGADMDDVEVQVTAWAYAAIVHLGISAEVLFHGDGYYGKSTGLIFTYTLGVFPGAAGLQAIGMTADREAIERGVPRYPHMLKWLRD